MFRTKEERHDKQHIKGRNTYKGEQTHTQTPNRFGPQSQPCARVGGESRDQGARERSSNAPEGAELGRENS